VPLQTTARQSQAVAPHLTCGAVHGSRGPFDNAAETCAAWSQWTDRVGLEACRASGEPDQVRPVGVTGPSIPP